MSASNAPATRTPERADFLAFMRSSVVLNKARATAAHPEDGVAADQLFSELMDELMREVALTTGAIMRAALDPQEVRAEFIERMDRALALPLPPDTPLRMVDLMGDGLGKAGQQP